MQPAGTGLWRSTLTLLAGGVVAQALPLLLGPWLTRLYLPEEFGRYAVFSAVAANLAVVACARYEYALPLVDTAVDARDLMALCLRIWLVVTGFSLILVLSAFALANSGYSIAGIQERSSGWGIWAWLPLAVAMSGGAQWLALWSTRTARFPALAASRVTQYGGGAIAQVAAGLGNLGAGGLVVGPIAATAASIAWLAGPAPMGGWLGLWSVPGEAWRRAARRFRDFPLLNTPHAFLGALQDTAAVALLIAMTGEASAGFWGLALRYLKAPATLVGSAVSQALYPRLAAISPEEGRTAVREVMTTLALMALPLVVLLLVAGPTLFAWAFGEEWRAAGDLARALAPYIGVHFVASPLAVVTLAWGAQRWALRLAVAGQVLFIVALAVGLRTGGLVGGAWSVSIAMVVYFGWYFRSLVTGRLVSDVRAA